MSMDRREFLKIASLSTILGGVGGATILGGLNGEEVEASDSSHAHKARPASTLAMVIDVRKFENKSDYQRCIDACHRAHNVPTIADPKHEVKWLWKEDFEHSFPGQGHEFMEHGIEHRDFMLLCNHCEKPACVRVCPTQATFKRKSDGIVMMDFHRCIGCRFCMAACPYGARSFNFQDPRGLISNPNPEFPTRMKGVVEKCNFCAERLRKGRIPACVEACQDSKAMVFGDLEDRNSEVRRILRTHYTIQRKPQAGTNPRVFYVIGG